MGGDFLNFFLTRGFSCDNPPAGRGQELLGYLLSEPPEDKQLCRESEAIFLRRPPEDKHLGEGNQGE